MNITTLTAPPATAREEIYELAIQKIGDSDPAPAEMAEFYALIGQIEDEALLFALESAMSSLIAKYQRAGFNVGLSLGMQPSRLILEQ